MNVLRRLPLSRLLLLCAVVLAVGIGATALASAVSGGPVPNPKPLPQAVHDALAGPRPDGVSANVTLTNHLLEGANIAGDVGGGGGELLSSPLVTGASGRLWIAKDGRVRLELQTEKGDTQVIYDGHTLSAYDAASNKLYRYVPAQATEGSSGGETPASHQPPTVAQIEEAITHISQHADLSGAEPSDVGGQPAYTVRVSPKEHGSLIGGAELAFDANNGTPLRVAVYSSTSSAPVLELAASEVSYGAVPDSVFAFTPPADAKTEELKASAGSGSGTHATEPSGSTTGQSAGSGHVRSTDQGINSIVVAEHPSTAGSSHAPGSIEGLPKVDINGATANELRTALGTVLSFERNGVTYLVAGALPSSAVEAYSRGL